MKRILILAYDFPPYVSVGALRPFSWYKYLNEFGIYPIVVTRQWSNKYGNYLDYIASGESKETIIEKSERDTIIKTPYQANLANIIMLKYGTSRFKFIRRIITAFYEIFQFLFFIGPKSGIYFGAKEYLESNKVDIIIASGEPHILFKYASKLSSTFNIPWIADYRDPWSQSPLRNKNFLQKINNKYFEKKYLKNVSAISTVSEYFAQQIKTILPDKDYYIVENGYDPASVDVAKGIKQTNDLFEIGFAGTLYKWHPIDCFLSSLLSFVNNLDSKNIRINFYGINNEENLQRLINTKFESLKDFVTIHPKISNNQMFKELSTKNIMLLFNDYTIVGTKIFDYLALKRAILFCFSEDAESQKLKNEFFTAKEISGISNTPQADIIRETDSGYVVKDTEELIEILKKLHKEFSETGYVSCNSMNYEKHSRRFQTSVLAEIINKTISNNLTKNIFCKKG